MVDAPATPGEPGDGAEASRPASMHWAARLEDTVHSIRASLARSRGWHTTVVAHTGYGGPGWVRALGRVYLIGQPRRNRQPRTTMRGWRSFTSVPVEGVEVEVHIGDTTHVVRAGRGGVVDVRLEAQLEPGWHTIELGTAESLAVSASVFIVDAKATFGLVSDIDDTVMVTSLPRPLLAAWNTFVLDEHARRPVAGMAVLYERLTRAHPDAPVIYLSTGAWNVAPTLTRFLERNLYPPGALLLTDWGPTHDRWFRNGPQHKRESLARLVAEFPQIKWLLVGDDGQHDESIYTDAANAHASHVEAVAIRQLSVGEAVFAGGRSKSAEHARHGGAPWFYAPDGAGLAEQLAAEKMI